MTTVVMENGDGTVECFHLNGRHETRETKDIAVEYYKFLCQANGWVFRMDEVAPISCGWSVYPLLQKNDFAVFSNGNFCDMLEATSPVNAIKVAQAA